MILELANGDHINLRDIQKEERSERFAIRRAAKKANGDKFVSVVFLDPIIKPMTSPTAYVHMTLSWRLITTEGFQPLESKAIAL